MKNIIMGFLLSLITMVGFSQSCPFYNGSSFIMKVVNGKDECQKQMFLLSKEDYSTIKCSELYKKWEKESLCENEENIETDKVMSYMKEVITKCVNELKYGHLDNCSSMRFLNGTTGMTYVDEKDGKLKIFFHFEADNDKGVSYIGNTLYSVDIRGSEPKTDCLVYNN